MALTATDVDSLTTTFIIPRSVQGYLNANPLWFRAKKRGIRYQGGTDVRSAIWHAPFVSGGAYQDRDTFSVANNPVSTHATYYLREYQLPISVSSRDMSINSGKAGVIDFVKGKTQHGKDSIADILGTDTQGSNSGGKELDGYGLMMSESSTYGGIAVADYTKWKAAINAAASNTMTILGLQGVLGETTFGGSQATLIVSNQSCYDKFSTFGDTVQRIIDTDMASVGIAQLNFRGVPWVVDSHVPGSGSGSTDNTVEFINENYNELWTDPARNFKVEKMARVAGEDVHRWQIWWAGNWVCRSRRHQGELTSVNPAL